jgi:predicted phage terminase large subunit-like protein
MTKLKNSQKAVLVATVYENDYCKQKPTKKQLSFLVREELEAMYGGAAAGGKSSALLMGALQYIEVPRYAALILRRTYADLSLPGAIMDRALEWLVPTNAHWADKDKTFTFPSGATLSFGYLESEKDKYRYQSSEFQYIGFDELTQFPETSYLYMFSRLRRLEGVDIPLRMRSATNPGGVGHEWVKARFLNNKSPDRVFIGAKLEDNPFIDQVAYEEALSRLDYVTRAQLRAGDWDILPSGGIFFQDNMKCLTVLGPNIGDNPDLHGCDVYCAVDPSEGGNDFAAIAIALKLTDGRLFVWDCLLKVENQSETIDKIIGLCRMYPFKRIWIEANSLGHAKNAVGMSLFEKELRDRSTRNGVVVPFKFIWTVKNKGDRIRSMEPHFSNGTLLFRSDWHLKYPELVNELLTFIPDNNKQHDDGPDALEMCVTGIFDEMRRPDIVPIAPIHSEYENGSPWRFGQREKF